MTSLYNCHTEGDAYRITKFSAFGDVESSYVTTGQTCECPAGHRHTCRHRQMLPYFLEREAVNSYWFLDWDRKGWVMNELCEGVNIYPLEEPVTSEALRGDNDPRPVQYVNANIHDQADLDAYSKRTKTFIPVKSWRRV